MDDAKAYIVEVNGERRLAWPFEGLEHFGPSIPLFDRDAVAAALDEKIRLIEASDLKELVAVAADARVLLEAMDKLAPRWWFGPERAALRKSLERIK